jgi:amino acid transporter
MMASLLFLLPLLIWYRYSDRIASNGGLYAFVEAATGPGLARVQAAFWIISYLLYLVYTVPFIVYDLLPVVFPQASRYQLLLDGLLAVVIAVIMLSPKLVLFSAVALIAAVQLVLALTLAGVNLTHLGVPASAFVGHGDLNTVLVGAGKTSSLYICASLPLFLGGEVRGGTRSVRQALAWAFPAVAILSIVGVFPLARASAATINTDIPGVSLARAGGGRTFAVLVGLGVAASVAGLIIVEFIALSRLLGTIFRRSSRLMVTIIAVVFLAASLGSFLNPPAVYRLLLKPSLIALWISQLLVVAVYPWFVGRHRRVLPGDIALAAGASLLMIFALVTVVTSTSAT